jgi:hypothetical protein
MPKRRPALTDEEGEVRELTREDFRGMRPMREAMPEFIEAMEEFRRKLGRPKAEAPKVHVRREGQGRIVFEDDEDGLGGEKAPLCEARNKVRRE